ncbi:MAG TPA: FAD-dependent oxidoreductase, partial [Dehalococcoidia bacterium]|nr:FAD-dependent oxidoreductase [Dehalococcoidia bacterium]
MSSATRFGKLLEPGYIGKVCTRNRILKTAAHAGLHNPDDGFMNTRTRAYYEQFARGGVGMMITGSAEIDYPIGLVPGGGFRIDDDIYIDGFRKLTDDVHRHDCPVFMQLFHMGPMHPSISSGEQPVAATSLDINELPKPQFDVARELSIDEIRGIVDKFARAAVRLKAAGFDGMELNASCAHLLNSFLSRAWNKRKDNYGFNSLENRARIVVEIIQEIKKRNGADFPVIVLINAVEYGLEDGIIPEESHGIARILQAAGADAIHVRAEFYRKITGTDMVESHQFPEMALYPELIEDKRVKLDFSRHGAGALVPLAGAMKKQVSIPIIAVGRIDADLGEEVLRRGMADFISMNRRLLADPELPNKIIQGRAEDIAPCTACLTCFGHVEMREPLQCRVNAALSRPAEYSINPAPVKKKVLVIGGGPAGMEVARVAALRGHQVLLFEKEPRLGGALPVAAMVKGWEREDIMSLAAYLERQIKKLGVEIRLQHKVDSTLVSQIKPDVVIIAAGGLYNIPKVPGIEGSNVLTGQALHRQLKRYLKFFSPKILRWLTNIWMPAGKRVVVMGGNIHGCQVAEFMLKRGRQVTIVETGDTIGEELVVAVVKPLLLGWLREKGVQMLTGVKYESINQQGLVITDAEGKHRTIAADTIITALPMLPNTVLMQKLQGLAKEIYSIGDSRE